jgi:hypothetical protein
VGVAGWYWIQIEYGDSSSRRGVCGAAFPLQFFGEIRFRVRGEKKVL